MNTSDRLKRLNALSPAKRDLLLNAVRKRATPNEPAGHIPRRLNRISAQPSFAQQRLWFLSELEPDNAFYNIGFAVRLSGRLQTAALEQTFDEIIRRHEALRTCF